MNNLTKIIGGTIALGTAVIAGTYLSTMNKDYGGTVNRSAYSAPSGNLSRSTLYEESKSEHIREQSVPGQIFDTFIEATHDHAKEKK